MKTESYIRDRLRSGQHTIGSWMQVADESVAELMGRAGYDWIAVDLEHGHFSTQQLPGMFRAIELGGTVPFARLAEASRKDIKAALDAGARGLILPMIESADQLEQAISWAKYPPQGVRGVGYSRANLFGKAFDAGMRQGADVVVVAQIEHIRAVENIEEILAVRGLDAIMVGPYDLSASMGLTGDFACAEFGDALKRIEKAARRAGVPSGNHVVMPDPKRLSEAIHRGHRFIAYGVDAVFLWSAANLPSITS